MKNSLNRSKNVRLFPVPCTKNEYQFKKTDREKLQRFKKSFSIRLRQLEQGTEEKDRIIMNTFRTVYKSF